MEKVECVVVGAGVIGLAIGRALAQAGREVLVLEAEKSIGIHASSRNSEVIHAGIYYPPGSFKARFCVEGKSLLYRYCEDRGIPCKRVGKMIVATSAAQIGALHQYLKNASTNGVDDLAWLDTAAISDYEPAVRGLAALYSPSTGIIDSHVYLQALQGELETAGGSVVCDTPVTRIGQSGGGFFIETGNEVRYSIASKYVVNATGLGAQQLAAHTTGIEETIIPPQQLVRGQYYSLSGPSPFSHLVYPVARSDSLGIHVTLDLAGQARFGPDAKAVDTLDYQFDESRLGLFAASITDYYPALDTNRLQPGYTGIRAALANPGPENGDFIIQGPRDHGVTGLVQLFGFESPGLTASLAIANYVFKLLA